MDRRGFLHGILALGIAPAIVRIGSLMPVRSIVIPTTAEVLAVGGNSLLSIDLIAREALRLLHTQTQFIRSINKSYDEKFPSSIVDTIKIRRPVSYG